MADEPTAEPSAREELQFDRADHSQPQHEQGTVGMRCVRCEAALTTEYYDLNGRSLCAACRDQAAADLAIRPGPLGFLKSVAGGVAGAIVGAGIYFAVLKITNYELAIIAILVGWLVGKGVHWGAGGRGGLAYQCLAVFLTYMAIVSTYIPLIITSYREQAQKEAAGADGKAAAAVKPVNAPATATPGAAANDPVSVRDALLAILFIFGFAAVVPFLAGFQNIVGILIIAIGLWQAWKINRRPQFEVLGPYDIGRS